VAGPEVPGNADSGGAGNVEASGESVVGTSALARAKSALAILDTLGSAPTIEPVTNGVAEPSSPPVEADGRRRKGKRVAKPDSKLSVSAAAHGVTRALFVHMTVEERRCLEHLSAQLGPVDADGTRKKLAMGKIIRGLIVEAHARMVDAEEKEVVG